MPEKKLGPFDVVKDVYNVIDKMRPDNPRGRFLGTGGSGGGLQDGPSDPFHNPLDGIGQLIIGGIAGALRRLNHPGHVGKILTTTATDVEWSGPLLDAAEGDVLYFDGSTWVDLPIGSSGQALRVVEVTAGHFQPRWVDVTVAYDVVVGGDSVVVGGASVVVTETI